MKLTSAQRADLESVRYFVPPVLKDVEITDADIEKFFAHSERGVKPEAETAGFRALREGKRWRGIHIHELYEPGILDGSVPYFTLLGGGEDETPLPRSVVELLKREMFGGKDAEVIEDCYRVVLAGHLEI